MRLEYDEAELLNMMKDFNLLTGMRIVLFDSNYRILLSWPEKDCLYCRNMKADPALGPLCEKNDRDSFFACQRSKELVIYHCHAGLVEATAPLTSNHSVIGYMMFGQICDRPDQLTSYTPDVLSTSDAQIRAAARIMEACTVYLIMKNTVTVRMDNFIRNMDSWLCTHLEEDLSAETICKSFGISRTKLYQVVNQYYGIGIAEHIKSLRIEKAKDLLVKTDLSVTDISREVGFSDYNYFCRVFKKETGTSAKKYRSLNGQVGHGY